MATRTNVQLPLTIKSVDDFFQALQSGTLHFADAAARSAAFKLAEQREIDLTNARRIIGSNDLVHADLSPFSNSSRGVFASKDLSAFTEISRTKPGVFQIFFEEQDHICDWCHKTSKDPYELGQYLQDGAYPALKSCAACKFCSYCSKECQTLAWNKYHKVECKAWKTRAVKDSTQLMAKPSMRSLIRYLAMHKMGTLPDEYLQEVLQLPYNSEQAIANEVSKSGVDRDLGGQMPIWVQFAINVSKSTMDLDVACKLFEILVAQTTIFGDMFVPLAEGLSFFASMINHSCVPNVLIHLDGDHVCVRTLKSVKAGEELTVAYVASGVSPEACRSILKKDHAFQCECPKCVHELLLPRASTIAEQKRQEQVLEAKRKLAEIEEDLEADVLYYIMRGEIGMIENRAFEAVRPVYADGLWPGLHSPMSSINDNLRLGYTFEGNKGGIFRIAVREFFSRYCEGKLIEQLGALISFERSLRRFAESRENHSSCSLGRASLQILTHGSLMVAAQMSEKILGATVLLTQGLKAKLTHYDAIRDATICPSYMSSNFGSLFSRAQVKLLRWAGVAQDKAIVVPN